MIRKILTIAMISGSLLAAACNTVEGAGEDMSSAGQAVAETADDAK